MVERICKSALLLLLTLGMAGCGASPGGSDEAPSNSAQKQENAKQSSDNADARTGPKEDAKVEEEQSENAAHPVVVIETSLGDITVELDAERTPLTVENFLRYVDDKFYDSTIIHQAVSGYAILGGTYSSGLREKPTRAPIRNEADKAISNKRGTIAMARIPDTIDSATSQFAINLVDNPRLDHKDRTPEGYGYCVFGKVVDGMDVVDKIGAVKVEESGEFTHKPVETVSIKQIRRAK